MATKYSTEFKKEVVQMYLSGIRPKEIVRTKNIKLLNIYDWLKAYNSSSFNNIHGNKKYGDNLNNFISEQIAKNPKTSLREIVKEWSAENSASISVLSIKRRLEELGFKYSKLSKSWKQT